MDSQSEYLSDELGRYSAECSRLARLSSRPSSTPKRQHASTYRKIIDWIESFGLRTGSVAGRHPQLVPVLARHSIRR
jgi:hypothetical protein